MLYDEHEMNGLFIGEMAFQDLHTFFSIYLFIFCFLALFKHKNQNFVLSFSVGE